VDGRLHRALFIVGLYLSFTTEGDYQQGETVRIMYIHVPSAWLSMMGYTIMSLSAIGTLVWRHPLADVPPRPPHRSARLHPDRAGHRLAVGQADVGHLVGLGCAADLRLHPVPDVSRPDRAQPRHGRPVKAARVSAVLILVGFVNIPIIKFSVDWWNTLHQSASVLRLDGSAIDPEFLRPLLVMAIAFTMLFFTLHVMAIRNEIWRRRMPPSAGWPPACQPGGISR
jgi:heme exporter protein C